MNKWKILTPILVVALLAFTFWYGGDAPELQGWTVEESAVEMEAQQETQGGIPEIAEETSTPAEEESPDITPESIPEEESQVIPEPVEEEPLIVEETPPPVDSQDAEITDTTLTVTLSVRCDTILDNMDWLTSGKESLVPSDGVIFPATEVTFYEGESVFNVLLREMKIAGIHMEYENTPLYNSAYIEGIGNLYEYDCGQLSGWLYSVNGWFPNYGCSRYSLQNGDVVEWVYSCDLGEDVGGGASAGGQYEG